MAPDRGPSADEVARLTDAELVRRFGPRVEGRANEEPPPRESYQPSGGPDVPRPLQFRPMPRWDPEAQPFQSEMARRLGAMLQAARMARGLSLADLARATKQDVSGMAFLLTELERGSQWWMADPGLFERACTEGGLDPDDPGLRNSYWFPLLDHPRCRTIRPAPVDLDRIARGGGPVVDLARSIARGRSFDLLPILADALEEAGCSDAEALAHCRTPGVHVLGCWVADALVTGLR